MRHPELRSQQHPEDKALRMPTIPGNPKHSALLCLGSISIPAGKLWHPVPRGNGFPMASPLLWEAENMGKTNPWSRRCSKRKVLFVFSGQAKGKAGTGRVGISGKAAGDGVLPAQGSTAPSAPASREKLEAPAPPGTSCSSFLTHRSSFCPKPSPASPIPEPHTAP